jgi:transcriptional regulator with PAS, ATPase and Fis domain
MNSHTVAGEPENVESEGVVAASPGDSGTNRKSFKESVHEFERQIIAEALAETGGRVTRAAKNLGLTHQGLCYIINHRHPDLLAVRRPIQVRRKSIIPKVRPPRRSR